MLNKLKKYKQTKHSPQRENGNALVMYIMAFPVVFSFFGLAVDATLATYTQTSLQSNLDAAVQSTLSRAVNPGEAGNLATQPTLTLEQAHQYAVNIYDANRIGTGEQPFIQCQTSPVVSPGAHGSYARLINPPSGCDWTETSFMFLDSGGNLNIEMSVTETSKTVFLQFLSIDHFTYNITSEARTSYAKN